MRSHPMGASGREPKWNSIHERFLVSAKPPKHDQR